MVIPVRNCFLPLVVLPTNRPQVSAAQHLHDLVRADPAEATDASDDPGIPASQTSTADSKQPLETQSAKSKPVTHPMRQEWKLAAGRADAKPKQQPESAIAESFRESRDKLQRALATLKDNPRDPNRQDAAHDAHAAFAQHPMPLGHRGVAVINKALKVGVAGSASTFGVGRTLGLQAGTNAVPVGNAPGIKNIQRAAAQLGFGAVGGAVGNLAGQTLVAPVVDMLPKQFQPIDPSAVLPDRMLAKMNRIRSGWGDEMRTTIAERQKEILQMSSNTNIHFGEKAFSAATVARMLLQAPGFKPSLPQTVALNSAVSVVAGGSVGLNMGVNMARSAARIPRTETLDRVLSGKPHERHEDAAMQDAQSLPLFYSHVTPTSQRRSIKDAITDSWHQGNVRDPAPAPWNPSDRMAYRDKGMRMQNIGADLRNIGQSIANRSDHLMRATAVPVAIATSQPFVVASMPNDFSARAASLALPAIAIKLVIRPWYNALVGGIPPRDAAMRAERQKAVDASAAAASATNKPKRTG